MNFKISKMVYFIDLVNHNNNNNNNNNIQLERFTRIRRRIWGFLVEKLIFVMLTEMNRLIHFENKSYPGNSALLLESPLFSLR